MVLRDIAKNITELERKIARHMRKDYRKAAGVVRFGLSDPQPVLIGSECMVRCVDADGHEVCISMEEAIGREWMPTLDEIYGEGGRADEARRLFKKEDIGDRRTGARLSFSKA